jgi:hypothetical protein
MKRISIVGLCLAAVFAFSAMAASSASAEPLLLLAQIAGGGSVENVTFLSEAILPLLLTHGGKEIHCKHAINHGLFINSTLGRVLILFLGCTTPNPLGGRLNCNTSGAGTGEIHIPLTTLFHLGLAHLTLTKGKIPAAVILVGDVAIECTAAVKILVLGNVIGAFKLDKEGEKPHAILPLNTPFLNALLSFEQEKPGLQHLRLFLFEHELRTYDLEADIGNAKELASEVANALLDLFRLNHGSGKHVDIELIEH